MSNFYIADLHLFHENVLKNERFHERPFETLEEMHKVIVDNWNEVVTNGDMVYLLGDVAHKGNPLEIASLLAHLKGQIVLIKGNHDKIQDQRLKKQFVEVLDYKEVVDNIDGKAVSVILSHYPIFSWKGQFRGAVHLYGHVHDNDDDILYQDAIKTADDFFKKRDGEKHKPFRAFNVGCMKDYMNYKPRTLKEIIAANT